MESSEARNREYLPPKAGEPPLHRAAREGDHAAIRRIVASGADVNAVFDIGLDPGATEWPATPLMVAAGSGDGATDSTVALLLELGADPKVILNGDSAATFAVKGLGWNYKPGGDAARAGRLLDAGSPLPQDPEDLNRLLCDVAAAGDAERVNLLLEHGLNPNGYWDPVAARENHQRMMEHMAEYRAGTPELFETIPQEFREFMEDGVREMEAEMIEQQVSAPSEYEIPLFRAARSGSAECVRLLLAAGADPKARDNSKRTAMYCANSVDVVRVLMKAGLPREDVDEYGWTPLVSLFSDGESAFSGVKALIEAGASVNAAHDRGYTVFMSAVGSGRYPALLRLLVASGADPHAVSELGYNAFHAAIDVNGEANAEESVRDTLGYLKELGVNIEHRNKNDQTPLARAIEDGTDIEVQVLCELGADPNAVCRKHDCSGESCTRIELPLLFHAANGVGVDKDVKTRALLRAGADPLATDADGFTPLMHVIASLCRDATDYDESYQAFLKGLSGVRLEGQPMPNSRDEFVAAAEPVLREYVEKFASQIPVSKASVYADTWRKEKLSCIVSLCAYECWARHERATFRPT
ncbi:MAG: ankyrin repeat domain-containing protein [Planctomycetota bacterium]|nr:ankyrin repeat domain-containing protein [Planctomycetota bacterium]